MCSSLSTSINVSLGRHGCKWIGAQAYSFMFQVYMDTARPEQERYIFYHLFVQVCISGTVSEFQP